MAKRKPKYKTTVTISEKTENRINYIRPLNVEQEDFVKAIRSSLLTIVDAKYGTGKTFLTLVESLKLILEGKFKKIFYVRPFVPTVGTDQAMGHLPGEMEDKLAQFKLPIKDNLGDLLTVKDLEYLFDKEIIEVCNPSFLRGRSLDDAIIILDEAQNADKDIFKLVLSRVGNGSICIVTGCSSQIDIRKKELSYLRQALVNLEGYPDVAVVRLYDCVRNSKMDKLIERL